MKGGKQRQAETRARQKKNAAKSKSVAPAAYRMLPVNEALLAPHNSYGVPDFVRRGYYVDVSFRCADCGSEEVWTGAQQKWWYEVAKASHIQRRFGAGAAGASEESGAPRRGGFTLKAKRKNHAERSECDCCARSDERAGGRAGFSRGMRVRAFLRLSLDLR